MQRYKCPVTGCDLEAERVKTDPDSAPFAEEYLVPVGKNLEDMPKSGKGHPVPLGVQRNILVKCPVHGKRYVLKIGHHASIKRK